MRASVNHILAALAGVLALSALLAGDVPETNRKEPQHVSAVDLASWIREQRAGLRVLDLRSRADFEQYHLPGAQRSTATATDQLQPDSAALVVVYAWTDAETRRVRARLQRRGVRVYELQGGIGAWLTDIMNPRGADLGTPEAQALYQRKRELADYFGGHGTRFFEPGNITTDQLIKRMRRRTC